MTNGITIIQLATWVIRFCEKILPKVVVMVRDSRIAISIEFYLIRIGLVLGFSFTVLLVILKLQLIVFACFTVSLASILKNFQLHYLKVTSPARMII